MAFTPDGSRLLSGGSDKVNVWDVDKQRRILSQAVPNSGYVQCLAASPDNLHGASAGRNVRGMASPTQVAREILDSLPEDCSLEEIQYRLHVRQMVEQGREDVRRGDLVSQEEIEQDLEHWIGR
jgi:WD40 repeat protein